MEVKLIEAVRIRKMLYDTSDPKYMKTKFKRRVWEEVAKEIQMSRGGVYAKALWEKLRHSFRDALRRQQKFLKSGIAVEDIKQWKYQKQMGFLKRFMTHRLRKDNIRNDNGTKSLSDSSSQDNNDDINKHKDLEVIVPVKHEFRTPQTPELKKKLKKDETVALLTDESSKVTAEEKVKYLEERNCTEPYKNDSLYHFFMSMYEMTKAMPPSAKHKVRNKIYNTVTEMEASLLNISPTQDYNNDSSSSSKIQTSVAKK